MPLTPVYTLLMNAVPAPMQPALPDPTAASPANPTVFDAFAAGETSGVSYKLNKNSRRAELTAALGGGAIGVGSGCELTDDHANALTINLSAGYVNIGGWIKMAALSLALANGTRSHLWLSRTGDLSARTDLTQPVTSSCYLGSVLTAGGDITEINYSGRERLVSLPFRRTGDAGAPNADMPSWWVGIVRTAGGIYWWDGTDYLASLDALTVKTTSGQATAGYLDAVITAGTGITLAVVDTGGGVYKLQVSAASALTNHTETFTVYTTVARGEVGTFRLDFSARGSFSGNYWVSIASDQEGLLALVLNSRRDGDALDFQVQVAQDAPAGSYGTYAQQALTFILIGPGWTAGATPTATPTVTPTAYDFSLDVPGPLTLTDAATIATDAGLGTPEGVTICRVSLASDRTLGAPTNPTDGQRLLWEVTNTDGSAHTLSLATGAGGFAFGTSITALTAIGAGKMDQIGAKYRAAVDRWEVALSLKGY